MTIKRRLIISNIIMITVPIIAFIVVAWLLRFIAFHIFGLPDRSPQEEVEFAGTMAEWWAMMSIFWFAMLGMGAIIFFNNWHVMKHIVASINAEHEKYENSRKELIAGISHDLRTPLTVIKASLEGLDTGVANTYEKQQRYKELLRAKTAHLETIINQLFLFSKLDLAHSDFPMNIQALDIGAFIHDLVCDVREEYKQKGLILTIEPLLSTQEVRADVQYLRQVFINILENSAKYKDKETGTVTIWCKRVKAAVEIHILDDGPGVSPQAAGKLFDVFYRSDPSRSKEGSGLGLAISAKILQHFAGSIRAECGQAGGLDVVLTLPAIG